MYLLVCFIENNVNRKMHGTMKTGVLSIGCTFFLIQIDSIIPNLEAAIERSSVRTELNYNQWTYNYQQFIIWPIFDEFHG